MTDLDKSDDLPSDPWRNAGPRFQVVAVVTLLSFTIFAFYDSRTFHARYLTRCERDGSRPECSFLNLSKPKSRPDLGIAMDGDSGRWALQLEATEELKAKETAARLWDIGANPRLVKMAGRTKVPSYYVQLGRFRTQKDAFAANAQLKAKGVSFNLVVAEYRSASK